MTATSREARGDFWYLPTDVVHYGEGSLDTLGAEADRLHAGQVFVVTSPSVAARTDLVEQVRALLGDRVGGVFDGVRPHVPYSCLQPGLDALRECAPDLLVSIGGGSVVDAARALALAAGEGLTVARHLERFRATYDVATGETTIPPTSGRALPLVAVPTTLSAAEFSNCGAVTSEERHTKDLLIADELTPRAVILDPQAGVHTPVDLWVATGMRAVDHAVETVCSPRRGPVTDALSLDSLRRLAAALRTAKADPADLDARAAGQVGAWMSYFGEMNLTLGLSHAVGHQLGAQFALQHGVTSCIVLPAVIRYLAPVSADPLRLVAAALGADVARLSAADAAEAAATAVEGLVADLGLPSRLSQVGVERSAFPGLAAAVMQDLVLAGSPRPVTDPAQIIELLEQTA